MRAMYWAARLPQAGDLRPRRPAQSVGRRCAGMSPVRLFGVPAPLVQTRAILGVDHCRSAAEDEYVGPAEVTVAEDRERTGDASRPKRACTRVPDGRLRHPVAGEPSSRPHPYQLGRGRKRQPCLNR